MMKKNPAKTGTIYDLLAQADQTYAMLPQSMRLEIEKISQGLSEFGPRRLRRRGTGTEFFESRDFRPDVDELRRINARLSARAGRPVVVENEAEIRQHFYLWRDASNTMNYRSKNGPYTKKEASEIMLLAFAKHLARNEELIGVLEGRGTWRGGNASEMLGQKISTVSVVTGDMPEISRRFPRYSTVVLFGDFLMKPEVLAQRLDSMSGQDLRGFMVMVLDPQEIDFMFKGHVEFNGMEGEGSRAFRKAESLQAAYQQKMRAHMEMVQSLAAAKGFRFILQRTDQPLHDALLAIYGLSGQAPAYAASPAAWNG